MNLKAKVVYKNRDLKPISECEYDLKDYTQMMSFDMKRIITDIEDLIYTMYGSKSKYEWDESTVAQFNKIKHKILDKAGELERLSDNIFDADTEYGSVDSFFDRLLNKFDEEE